MFQIITVIHRWLTEVQDVFVSLKPTRSFSEYGQFFVNYYTSVVQHLDELASYQLIPGLASVSEGQVSSCGLASTDGIFHIVNYTFGVKIM